MAIWLLPSEESKTRRKGHTNALALVPGKWNCRQWYVSGGRHERKAVLPKVAPILFTIYLWWQLFLIEQDESVVCGAEPQLFLQVRSNAVEVANHAVLLYKQREELLIQAVGIRSVCSRCHLTDRQEAVPITGRRATTLSVTLPFRCRMAGTRPGGVWGATCTAWECRIW